MSIVQEGKELVNGDRQEEYGDISDSFIRIAGLWSAYLDVRLGPLDIANLMILLKVSRAKHKFDRDSYVDIVGYVECADQLLARAAT